MAHGQETGSGKPALRQALQARGPDLDLIFGLPSGPAACEPSRIKGRTHVSTRPRAGTLLKISLAPKGASTHVANSGVGRRMGGTDPGSHTLLTCGIACASVRDYPRSTHVAKF